MCANLNRMMFGEAIKGLRSFAAGGYYFVRVIGLLALETE